MRVSIITPALNSAQTIEDTIRSVLAQSYQDIEYLIIDGGSTDQTLAIVGQYQGKISKVVSEPDGGIYDAMNKGISLASGEIIGILNSDDIYADDRVIEQVVAAMSKSGAEIGWGDLVYVKKNDPSKVTRVWRSSAYAPGVFQKGWQPPHPTVFVRKSVYERLGGFNTALPISADYELMLRLLEKNQIASVYLPAVLVRMREGGNSNWKNLYRVFQANQEVRRAWAINHLSMPASMILLKLVGKIRQIF